MDEKQAAGGAPADWYPDPTERHQHRYWDGAAWTLHVADDGVASIDPLAGEPASATDEAAAAAAQYPPEVEALLPALFDAANPAGQLDAAAELGDLGDPSAVAPLVEVATTTGFKYTTYVRLAAIEALGVLGDPSAAPPIIAAVVDGDTTLARDNESTLGPMLARTADRTALAPLAEKAASANEEFDADYPDWYDPDTSEFYMDTPRAVENEISDMCAAILGFAGPYGVECLLGALGAPRESVARRLGAVEDPPIDRLVEAAGSAEGNVRAAALLALFVVAHRGIERTRIQGMLEAALDDEDERVRDEATGSLHWLNVLDEGE